MSARAQPAPTPDLSLVVPGRLRHWVAEAIFAQLEQLALDLALESPRRRRRVLKPFGGVPDELRDLAARIQP